MFPPPETNNAENNHRNVLRRKTNPPEQISRTFLRQQINQPDNNTSNFPPPNQTKRRNTSDDLSSAEIKHADTNTVDISCAEQKLRRNNCLFKFISGTKCKREIENVTSQRAVKYFEVGIQEQLLALTKPTTD